MKKKPTLYTNPRRIDLLTDAIKAMKLYRSSIPKGSNIIRTHTNSVLGTMTEMLKDEKVGWADEAPGSGRRIKK